MASYAEMKELQINNQGYDPLSVAREVLKKALDAGTYERSVRNCHHAGVDSIVLFDDTADNGGMVRFFYARHGEHSMNSVFDKKGHFTLGMHNHRYGLTLVPLLGSIVNIETVETHKRTGIVLHEYDFASALADEDREAVGTVHRRRATFKPLEERRLDPGDSLYMEPADLHTVLVPDTVMTAATAWMVIEGPDEGVSSRIYSPRDDLEVTTTDLYQPMTRADAIGTTERVLDAIIRG